MKAKRVTFKGFDGKDYRGIYIGKEKGTHTVVYSVYAPGIDGPITALLNNQEFKARVEFVKA